MEYLDVLDDKGNKTGKTKEKAEVHRDGDWHRVVHVWVVNSKKEILFQLRAKEMEAYPDMWDISTAGHIEAGEDSITAAIRETKEEIGIDISKDEVRLIGHVDQQREVLNNGNYLNNEFVDVYLYTADIGFNDFKMLDGEVKKVKWVPLSEFKNWVENGRNNVVSRPKVFSILLKAIESL